MDLELKNIHLRYGVKKIFDDLSIDIPTGDKLAIAGESGAGKSSFLNLLLGFVKASSGTFLLDGEEAGDGDYLKIRKMISWVPQDLSLQIERVRDLVLYPFSFASNKSINPSDDELHSLLDKFKLRTSILDKFTSEISGGEKQRLLLISSVLQKKPIILLDEPSSSLDKNSKKIVADYFYGLHNQTVIASSHDPYWIDGATNVLNLDTAHE